MKVLLEAEPKYPGTLIKEKTDISGREISSYVEWEEDIKSVNWIFEKNCVIESVIIKDEMGYVIPFCLHRKVFLGNGSYVRAGDRIEVCVADTGNNCLFLSVTATILDERTVKVIEDFENTVNGLNKSISEKEIEKDSLISEKKKAEEALIKETKEKLLYKEELLSVYNSKIFKMTEPVRKMWRQINGPSKEKFLTEKPDVDNVAEEQQEKPESLKETVTKIPKDIQGFYESLERSETVTAEDNGPITVIAVMSGTESESCGYVSESLKHQEYKNTDLKFIDASKENYSDAIHHIVENTDSIYLCFVNEDTILHPDALAIVEKLTKQNDYDFIYADEALYKTDADGKLETTGTDYKPEYSYYALVEHNYMGKFLVVKTELMKKFVNKVWIYGIDFHDIALCVSEICERIHHIDRVFSYSEASASYYDVNKDAGFIREYLDKKNIPARIDITDSKRCSITYDTGNDKKVSIIIPNKDHIRDLKRIVNSILRKSTYQNMEILIIENNSVEKETFDYYEELKKNPVIRICRYDGEFNYSKINNFGVSKAIGEYLLLLNNDMRVITPDFIEKLLGYAIKPDVGIVGGMLYYPDKTIQHAGVVIGAGADHIAGHVGYKSRLKDFDITGHLTYAHEVMAVTAACLMVEKKLYENLLGLDEEFAVAYNDVDFCLKVISEGLKVIFNPHCELYHYESKSRGYEDTPEKIERFNREKACIRKKWQHILEQPDPYVSFEE